MVLCSCSTMVGDQLPSDILVDRISSLPREVIDHILIHLPLRDAMRTSILSTRWRHNWLTIPHFVVNRKFINSRLISDPQLESIIYHILLGHKGTIVKFLIEINHNDIISPNAIDHWLHFLSNHHCIEDLKLVLCVSDLGHHVIQYVFSFEHLKKLHVEYVEVKVPSSFAGFSKLVELYLSPVCISLEMLKTIISKCPVLEFLIVGNSKDSAQTCLDISAPNLKSFEYTGLFSSICFDTPCLEKISIKYYSLIFQKESGSFKIYDTCDSCRSKNNFILVFSQLPSIKKFSLEYHFLEFLAVGGVPRKLPNNLNHLTSLFIDYIDLQLMNHVSILVCLIKSSPNLQSLHLALTDCQNKQPATLQYLRAQQKFEVSLSCSLKNVLIEYLIGYEAETEFVKLLLSSATALQNLEIKPEAMRSPNTYKNTLENFPRASSEAVIMVNSMS